MPDPAVNNPDEQSKNARVFARLLQAQTMGHTLFQPNLSGEGKVGDLGEITCGSFEKWFNVLSSESGLPAFKLTDADYKLETVANNKRPYQSSEKRTITIHGALENNALPPGAHPLDFKASITANADEFAWLQFAGQGRQVLNLRRPAEDRLGAWIGMNYKALSSKTMGNPFIILTKTVKSAGWKGGVRQRDNSSVSFGLFSRLTTMLKASAKITRAESSDSGFVETHGPPRNLSFDPEDPQFTIVCGYLQVNWINAWIYRLKGLSVASEDAATMPDLGDTAKAQIRGDGEPTTSVAVDPPVGSSGNPTDSAPGGTSSIQTPATARLSESEEHYTLGGGTSGDSTVLSRILERTSCSAADDIAFVFAHSNLITDYIDVHGEEPNVTKVRCEVKRIPLADNWFALKIVGLTRPPGVWLPSRAAIRVAPIAMITSLLISLYYGSDAYALTRTDRGVSHLATVIATGLAHPLHLHIPAPRFDTLLQAIEDTIRSTEVPYRSLPPGEKHLRGAMLLIVLLVASVGAFLLSMIPPENFARSPHVCPDSEKEIHARHGLTKDERKKELDGFKLHCLRSFQYTELTALRFLSIGVFCALVYFQNGRTTRGTFVLAVAHNQIEVLLSCLLLNLSHNSSVSAAIVYGLVMYPVVLFAPSMALVFIGAAVVGGANDFLIVFLLSYAKQWRLAVGTMANVCAVLAFTCTFGVIPYLCICFGICALSTLTISGILHARELHHRNETYDDDAHLLGSPVHDHGRVVYLLYPDIDPLPKERSGTYSPVPKLESREYEYRRALCYRRNPMQHTSVPRSVLIAMIVLSFVSSTFITAALAYLGVGGLGLGLKPVAWVRLHGAWDGRP